MKSELKRIITLCDIDGINSRAQIKQIARELIKKIESNNNKRKQPDWLDSYIDELIRSDM